MLSLLIPCTVLLLLACSDSKKDAPPTAPDLGAVSLALIDIEFSGDAARALFDGPENARIVLPTAPCQSTTINLRLDGFVFPRPMSQDLLISAADSLGSPITEVLFELTDGIPHAHLALGGDAPAELDATISDGLAIHQWAGVPLLATPTLTAAYADTTPAGKTTAATAPRTEGPLHLPSARLAQSDGFVEMRILGIGQTEEELAILLVDLEDRLVFPFFVGLCQAASINATLNRLNREEASTHALFHELLVTSKATVTHGRITELRENTYIGAVSLVRRQREIVLDARPSDAVALALRAGARIEVATDLLASVGEEAGPYLEIFAAGKTAHGDFFPSLGNISRP